MAERYSKKVKYIVRNSKGEVIGTRSSFRKYTHAVICDDNGVGGYAGSRELAEKAGRKLEKWYTVTVAPVEIVGAPAPEPAPAPAPAPAPEPAPAPAPEPAPAPAPEPAPVPMDSKIWGTVVTYDDLASLLCCALEGGSDYWATFTLAYEPSGEELNSPAFGDWKGDSTYTITHPAWEIIVQRKTLKLPDLLKGLRIMRRDYPRHWKDFIGDNSDAVTGDVFLQCAVLGEVVYG